ncbi:hypothetical protein E4T56_gene10557 [Termitomyces sp. T112]|nr:hypothetical protein E4T56_gene10557 [Termitomyces sp. T112]
MLTVCALVLSHNEALGQLIASHSHAPIEPEIRNPQRNEPVGRLLAPEDCSDRHAAPFGWTPDQTSSRGRYLPDRTEPIRWTTHCISSLLELLTPILTPTRATTRLVSEGLDLLPNPSHRGNFSFSDLSRAWWSHCLIEPRA